MNAAAAATRLQAQTRLHNARADITGARDDFLATCRRLDADAPCAIAARPRWRGAGLCAPMFAAPAPPGPPLASPPPSPDRPLAAPRSPARPPLLPTPPASPARLPTPPASPTRPPHYVSSPESPASSLEAVPARRAPPPLPLLSPPASPSEQLEAAVSEDKLRRELAWAAAALRSRLEYLEACPVLLAVRGKRLNKTRTLQTRT